jgi:hypothetical protein
MPTPLFTADGYRWSLIDNIGSVPARPVFRLERLNLTTNVEQEVVIDPVETFFANHQAKTTTRAATDPNFYAALQSFVTTGIFPPGDYTFTPPKP